MASNDEQPVFACYLLVSESDRPALKGRTYIGFTTDPTRRLAQHNGGQKAGGAKKTEGRGPWKMIAFIHGFPNEVSALRFEWAWQNPHLSRRLSKVVPGKRRGQRAFEYKVKILDVMLNTGPWSRLPLSVHWYVKEYASKKLHVNPPVHMEQSLSDDHLTKADLALPKDDPNLPQMCDICGLTVDNMETASSCPSLECGIVAHRICLARHSLPSDSKWLVPVYGNCTRCSTRFLWGLFV